MDAEQLLRKTQEEIKEYQSRGRRNRYPQSIKDAIVSLSQNMSAHELAKKLGVSRPFIYKCSDCHHHNTDIKSIPSSKTKDMSTNNIQLQEITHQLKSFMKEDRPTLEPSMRLTTNSGVIVEIF